MFSVYKITNNINNKCYIGSSIRPDKRWRQHKNSAFNPNSPNYHYPLYQAFRKYGIENFTFEIIADDFSSIKEMEDYEAFAIIHYHGYGEGYNQTLNTHSNNICHENCIKHIQQISCKCARIDKNNNIIEIYSSYHDAARKNGLDEDKASKVRAVCKGVNSSINGELIFRDLDENGKIIQKEFKPYKQRKTLIAVNIENPDDIKYFESVSVAAQELQTERRSVQHCIQGSDRYSKIKGYILREIDSNGDIIETEKTIEDRIAEYNITNPIINGERHSITEWCNIYGIARNTFYYRRKKGMSVIEALTNERR